MLTPRRPRLLLSTLAATALLSTTLLATAPVGAEPVFDGAARATVPTSQPQIRAFAATEPGFNPETASTAELERHGLPLPPSATANPGALRQWQDIVRHARYPITPQFTPRPGRNGPQSTRGAGTSQNWSGAAVSSPTCSRRIFCPVGATRILAVEGHWVVPAVDGSGQVGTASTWVGLDGYTNKQVQQIGTDATNTDFGFALYDAWYELYPDDSLEITNLAIRPGDQMFGLVQYDPGSNSIHFFLLNLTTGEFVSFTAPAKYGSPGDNAEWIVERPGYFNTFDHPLPAFGTTSLTGLWFQNDQGAWYPANGSSPYTSTLIDMYGFDGLQLDHTAAAPDGFNAAISVNWLNYQ
jgi:hypothetical protein